MRLTAKHDMESAITNAPDRNRYEECCRAAVWNRSLTPPRLPSARYSSHLHFQPVEH